MILCASLALFKGDTCQQLDVFATCQQFIETIPALPPDPPRTEDVDTWADDHLYGAVTYALPFAAQALAVLR